MLAYSSVAQIGYIYMGIGYGNNEGMIAACIHILVHAVTKSMLFCAAGGLMEVSENSRDFSKLKGAGYRNKLAGAAFVVGALSMIGIPFLQGSFQSCILPRVLFPGRIRCGLSFLHLR